MSTAYWMERCQALERVCQVQAERIKSLEEELLRVVKENRRGEQTSSAQLCRAAAPASASALRADGEGGGLLFFASKSVSSSSSSSNGGTSSAGSSVHSSPASSPITAFGASVEIILSAASQGMPHSSSDINSTNRPFVEDPHSHHQQQQQLKTSCPQKLHKMNLLNLLSPPSSPTLKNVDILASEITSPANGIGNGGSSSTETTPILQKRRSLWNDEDIIMSRGGSSINGNESSSYFYQQQIEMEQYVAAKQQAKKMKSSPTSNKSGSSATTYLPVSTSTLTSSCSSCKQPCQDLRGGTQCKKCIKSASKLLAMAGRSCSNCRVEKTSKWYSDLHSPGLHVCKPCYNKKRNDPSIKRSCIDCSITESKPWYQTNVKESSRCKACHLKISSLASGGVVPSLTNNNNK